MNSRYFYDVFDAHEIVERLWLGSADAACGSMKNLKERNITHILTIEDSVEPQFPGVSYFFILNIMMGIDRF